MDLSAHTPRTRSRVAADDRGIMIIEVLVSAVLLVVISLATLSVIDRAGAVSSDNRARSVSTTLAQRDQDLVRQLPFAKVSALLSTYPADPQIGDGGTLPKASPNVDVDGRTYTVVTTVKVVEDKRDLTACLAGWQGRRILIRTVATPPAGNDLDPVVMQTYRVPSITDKAEKGSVIVRLSKADGTGKQDVPVNVTGKPQKLTGSDGCAVINDVEPAKGVVVSWGTASGSDVDENGAPLVKRIVTITAGKTAQFAGRFDAGMAADVTLKDENDNDGTWDTLSVVNSGISTVYNGVRTFGVKNANPPVAQVRFTTIKVPGLFPFKSPYGIFAGDCWGNNPDVWGGTQSAMNSVLMTGNATPKVLMPSVTVQLSSQPSAGDGSYRVFLAYDRRVDKMGTGRCDITDGVLPNDNPGDPTDPGLAQRVSAQYKSITSATPNARVSYPMPYGIYVLCIDNPTKNKHLNKAYRFDNVPAGAPFYTQPRSQTVDKVAIDNGDSGRCEQDGAKWPAFPISQTNPPTS